MAYLRNIERRCQGCNTRAKVELVNRFNSSCGVYCNACSKVALKKLSELENERTKKS